jgi:hypothetical protein
MKIREALREGSHIVIHYEDGKKNAFLCETVKAGLVWPETLETPAYYCILGQSEVPNKKGKKPLNLLIEAQEALPDKLYEKLIQDSRRLLCWDYFADFTHEKNLDYYQGFDRFMTKRDLNRINLHPASVTSYAPGLLIIRDWIDNEALDIPRNSVLGQQLGEIRKAEQGQEPKNYAANALRCVIGSFDVQPCLGRNVKASNYVYY